MSKKRKKISSYFHFASANQVEFQILLKIFFGFLLCIFASITFNELIEEIFNHDILQLDVSIAHWFYSLRSPLLNIIFFDITFFGSPLFVIFTGVLVCMYLVVKRKFHDVLFFATTMVFGGILIDVSKLLIKRPRPQISPLTIETSYSFPSGHAMDAVFFYGALAILLRRYVKNTKIKVIAILACILFIILISISRVYLGVHYPSDVLGGIIEGAWWIVMMLLFEKILLFFKLFRQRKR